MIEGKRIAILVEEGFEDAELMEPLRAMRDAGVRVSVVGSDSKKSHKGKRGSAGVTVDTTADKVETSQFDATIIPGGYAPDQDAPPPADGRSDMEGVRQGQDNSRGLPWPSASHLSRYSQRSPCDLMAFGTGRPEECRLYLG